MKSQNWIGGSLAFALFLFAGCANPGPELIPASGKITINGKPAGNIVIQFLPDVGENVTAVWPSSQAISSEDGSFELRTSDDRPGAVPGQHKLILVDADEERPAQGEVATKPSRLDSSYAVAGRLTAIVEPGKPIEIVIP